MREIKIASIIWKENQLEIGVSEDREGDGRITLKCILNKCFVGFLLSDISFKIMLTQRTT
jgi:hypothetical protein